MAVPDCHIRGDKSKRVEMVDGGLELSLVDLQPCLVSTVCRSNGVFYHLNGSQTDDGPCQSASRCSPIIRVECIECLDAFANVSQCHIFMKQSAVRIVPAHLVRHGEKAVYQDGMGQGLLEQNGLGVLCRRFISQSTWPASR